MTTKLLAFTAAAFLAIPGAAGAQAVNGYGSAGRATIVEEDGLLLTHYGGGLDLITGSDLGASIEAGRTARSGLWINHVSVDGTYHRGRTARRVTPFVAGGDSRFFAEGEGANPPETRFGSDRLAPTFVATRESQGRVGYARSFEQLQVFVGPGDTISVREASGEEFSARIADLSATELVVIVDGRRRAFHADDVLRIRQRRGDSLANGTWLGFGIGAGLALGVVATDDSGFVDTAGFAVLLAGIYGGVGAGIGVGVDALIRHRRVIYDHQPAATSDVAIVPFIGVKSAGAMVAVRF